MGKILGEYRKDDTVSRQTGLAQWVFRKLRNHDPLSVVDDAKRRAGLRPEMRVQHMPEGNVARYVLNDGSVFEITVTQVQGPQFVEQEVCVEA